MLIKAFIIIWALFQDLALVDLSFHVVDLGAFMLIWVLFHVDMGSDVVCFQHCIF